MKHILLAFLLIPALAFAENDDNDLYSCNGKLQDVKFAVIDDATSGDNTLIAAVTGKKLRVLSYVLASAGTVTARFESGAGGTALTGQMTRAANGDISANCGMAGCFETAAGALLNLELSAAISVDGHLTYVECD